MYEISIQGTFTATHRLEYPDGNSEAVRAHDWRVSMCVAAEELNGAGMVADFTALQALLDNVLAQLHRTHLNDHTWLEGMSPTAERVARTIFERLLCEGGSWDAALRSVEVTEAPGCAARYVRP